MSQTPSAWTNEIVQALKLEWAEGRSGSIIARGFNSRFKTSFTRCSVLGKARRLGLLHGTRSSPGIRMPAQLPSNIWIARPAAEGRLRALWAGQLTLDQIAATLWSEFGDGFTPASLRMKALRLGLPRRGPGLGLAPQPRSVSSPKPAKPAPAPHRPPPILTVVPAAAPEPLPAYDGPTLSILELTSTSCKFPVSGHGAETRFCGAPHDDGPYCARHSRIAFVAQPKKQIKPPYEATVVTTGRVREPKRASA